MYPFLAITACLVAVLTLFAGFSQITALHLREEQSIDSPHGDVPSGAYGGSSTVRSNRSSYGGFSGGGPGSGK